MNTYHTHFPIHGSAPIILTDSLLIGPAPFDHIISVTILLRACSDQSNIHLQTMVDHNIPDHYILNREEFAEKYIISNTDINIITNFANQYSLKITELNKAYRTIVLSGTVNNFNHAFNISINYYGHISGNYHSHEDNISVPFGMGEIIEGIFGLDNRRLLRTKYHKNLVTTNTVFTPPELAKIYNFPPTADGSGQCIGIIELGGGSSTTDLTNYFISLGITPPKIVIVSVDNATSQPDISFSANSEVMLDIEIAGAIAPAASIVVYFAPNNNKGFIDAITTAIHDTVNKPAVISISWGESETLWTPQAMTAFESVFVDAAAMGITICAASGDKGSSDSIDTEIISVDFPASAPHILGIGGTTLCIDTTKKVIETVWNNASGATGGGYSSFFTIPAYQTSLNFTQHGRGIPDVAANADPTTGYIIQSNGDTVIVGGTSAATPLWAGLIALINQELGHPIGFLNPLLYNSLHTQNVTNDIITGNNGAYHATPGWDACTGWGSPNGQNLLTALKR